MKSKNLTKTRGKVKCLNNGSHSWKYEVVSYTDTKIITREYCIKCNFEKFIVSNKGD